MLFTLPQPTTVAYRRAYPLLGLFVYLASSLILGALLTFPAYVVLRDAVDVAFDSVLHRVVGLTLLLLLPLYLARGDGATPEALGFASSRRAFARGFSAGFALGILLVSPLIAAFLLLGIRAPTLSAFGTLADVGLYLGYALLTAAMIGLIEEAYFRGALLAPLRLLPAWLSISIVSVVYAAVHFLGTPMAPENPGWFSGLSSIARSQVSLGPFLALVAAGLLLGAIRYRSGGIALGAGFHAGWVCIMKLNQEYSDVDSSSELLFLQGSFGGTMGYLGLAWIGLLGAGWLGWERRAKAAARRRASGPLHS